MKLPLITKIIIVHCVVVQAVPVDLSNVSECVLSCLVQAFSAANCSLFDTNCQCNNQNLVYSTSTCTLQECPLADSAALGKLRDQICGRLPKSRHKPMLIVNTTMGSVSTLVVALRLLSRYLISKKLWVDDYLILTVLAINIPSIATGAWMQLNGLGEHIWYLPVPRIPKILRLFYVSETLYLLILTLTKISILLFYLRIFPRRRFRIATYTTLLFVIFAGIVILFLQIFQCWPIAYNWDRSIKVAKCLNINVLSYTHAGMSILQDFMILLLPIPELLSLKMAKRQKIGLIIVFQIGLFACITSIVRLQALTQFDGTKTIDPTWDNVNATIWTAVEINITIICSSLPALRPLLRSTVRNTLCPVHKRPLAFEQLKTTPNGKFGNYSSTPTPGYPHEQMYSHVTASADMRTPWPLTAATAANTDEGHHRPYSRSPRSVLSDNIALDQRDNKNSVFASDVLFDFSKVETPTSPRRKFGYTKQSGSK